MHAWECQPAGMLPNAHLAARPPPCSQCRCCWAGTQWCGTGWRCRRRRQRACCNRPAAASPCKRQRRRRPRAGRRWHVTMARRWHGTSACAAAAAAAQSRRAQACAGAHARAPPRALVRARQPAAVLCQHLLREAEGDDRAARRREPAGGVGRVWRVAHAARAAPIQRQQQPVLCRDLPRAQLKRLRLAARRARGGGGERERT